MINEIRQMIRETLQESSFGRTKEKMESEEFVIISAYRDYRTKRHNMKVTREMEADISAAGYSFTQVGGGYKEPTVHGDEETGFHLMRPEGDDWEVVRHDVVEASVVITSDRRPDKPMETRTSLFDLAKKLAVKYDQDSFIYGYPTRVTNSVTQQITSEMFITAYARDAKSPGREHREPWAGPWTKFNFATDAEEYFTKVAGKKGKLTEEFYKNALLEVMATPVGSRHNAMKKQYVVNKYRNILQIINNA